MTRFSDYLIEHKLAAACLGGFLAFANTTMANSRIPIQEAMNREQQFSLLLAQLSQQKSITEESSKQARTTRMDDAEQVRKATVKTVKVFMDDNGDIQAEPEHIRLKPGQFLTVLAGCPNHQCIEIYSTQDSVFKRDGSAFEAKKPGDFELIFRFDNRFATYSVQVGEDRNSFADREPLARFSKPETSSREARGRFSAEKFSKTPRPQDFAAFDLKVEDFLAHFDIQSAPLAGLNVDIVGLGKFKTNSEGRITDLYAPVGSSLVALVDDNDGYARSITEFEVQGGETTILAIKQASYYSHLFKATGSPTADPQTTSFCGLVKSNVTDKFWIEPEDNANVIYFNQLGFVSFDNVTGSESGFCLMGAAPGPTSFRLATRSHDITVPVMLYPDAVSLQPLALEQTIGPVRFEMAAETTAVEQVLGADLDLRPAGDATGTLITSQERVANRQYTHQPVFMVNGAGFLFVEGNDFFESSFHTLDRRDFFNSSVGTTVLPRGFIEDLLAPSGYFNPDQGILLVTATNFQKPPELKIFSGDSFETPKNIFYWGAGGLQRAIIFNLDAGQNTVVAFDEFNQLVASKTTFIYDGVVTTLDL